MPNSLENQILEHLRSGNYQPLSPRGLARQLEIPQKQYHAFRDALRELMHEGRVVSGSRGAVLLPSPSATRDAFIGSYRHNRRGFGFVVPTDPQSHEDLFIPPGDNGSAMTGDTVRARITSRGQRDGKALYTGRVLEVLKRGNNRFVGALVRQGSKWMVLPDGNTITEPVLTPDAGSRRIKPGTKVVVELTQFPENGTPAMGVIAEVLGKEGDKDVDLKSIIIQHNLPGPFPEEVLDQARSAVASFDPHRQKDQRLDLSGLTICTIDPPDAKDYDDAISLTRTEGGLWELGVHIADVSAFVPPETPLDDEARSRGNSVYFPGHVIPMLPEILSNGVCSLQEGAPRLCKSVFITYDEDAQPIRSRFANSVITSACRLRYIEAQALIDGKKEIPHPDGDRKRGDYPKKVVKLLGDMNELAKRLQKRRIAQGQINLDLPEIRLVLDDNGKVVDAVPEDTSFTHTLIEMFMVEANEAVARLLNSLEVPFLRRVHPEPDAQAGARLSAFAHVAGYKVPKKLDRAAIQALLSAVRGKPESFAMNLAILKSLTRAEYSPRKLGHYALASEQYCHFTSPIRRYADLTIHRLLDDYLAAKARSARSKSRKKAKIVLEDEPNFDDLTALGRHISFTERRAEDAERELRQVKILSLLAERVGEKFTGVITGITSFGVFVQIQPYLIDGLIRYEHLLDDWWDVDEKAGIVRGQRTGVRLGIGNVVQVVVARVDLPRRELDLRITKLPGGQSPSDIISSSKEKRRNGGRRKKNGSGRQKHTKRSR